VPFPRRELSMLGVDEWTAISPHLERYARTKRSWADACVGLTTLAAPDFTEIFSPDGSVLLTSTLSTPALHSAEFILR